MGPTMDLEKIIAAGLALTIVVVVGVTAYAVREPQRMAEAQEKVFEESLEHGAKLYSANCAVCHGKNGEGVPNLAPALNSKNYLQAADDGVLTRTITQGK